MNDTPIKLNADETRLLLAAKNHEIKGVSSNARIGSYEYIQDVCNYRCGISSNASVFHPYNELASKLLTPRQYAILFDNLYRRFSNPFMESPEITARVLAETLIIAVAGRRVTDLILDESLTK